MQKSVLVKLVLYLLIPLQLLIFTFLVPPFQKPDEQPHFEKSLLVSKGYLFCQKKSNNTVKLGKKYVDFIKTPYLDLMTHGKNTKLPMPVFMKDLFSNNQSSVLVNFNVDHLCSFPIISYLPQAFTLVVTSLFKINPILSLYLGRLVMSILGYFWFLYLYKKITDDYKLILLFTFALPMTLHQVSSFSYDALHIMFALTFFTLLMSRDVINHVSTKYFKLFFVLFLFLATKKIGYETFFLFLFLIPFEIKPMIISSLIFIPFYFISKLTGSFDIQNSLTNQVISPIHQLNFLFSNPLNIFNVLITTTIQRFTFYLQSLIGIFGWLEYGLDPLSYFLYGLFFVYVLINVETRHALSLHKNKTILLSIILFISYMFIVLLAFVFNTSSGTLIAHGVQGRYFIPFLPFIIFLIVQFKRKFKQKLAVNNIFYYMAILYLVLATFYAVFNRYY
ncbi:MAG: DUF2142 domain-containing protein [Patescibacteria group bacterium]|jgi:uncharacterized membrane protein